MPVINTQQIDSRMELMIDRMIERAERTYAQLPDYGSRLLALAKSLSSERAFQLGRMAQGTSADPEFLLHTRAFLSRLVPGYHLSMLNDRKRNEAWERALTQLVKPGMRVLEIGTGPGLLALMAARAGAQKVTTCEYHRVVAGLAREIIERNGYADRIDVFACSSYDLKVGVELEERVDLFFCDNFSDNMYSFEPLKSIADVRARLARPGARAVPAAARVRLALADWQSDERFFRAGQRFGFDMSPATSMVPAAVDLEIGDLGMRLMSREEDAFCHDFSATSFEDIERSEVLLEMLRDGTVNGICQWIRLELTDEIVLEARPEPGTNFFSNPRFYPLLEPLQLRRGDVVRVHAKHDGHSLQVWASEVVSR